MNIGRSCTDNPERKSRMSRIAKASPKKDVKKDWPMVVYMWIVGLGIFGYVGARIALDGRPHPLHWVSGIGGAVVGYFVGWLWYRWRGDVI